MYACVYGSACDIRLAKFDMDKTKIQGFRENLKSTGQSKFTLDEKEETAVRHHIIIITTTTIIIIIIIMHMTAHWDL